MAKYAVVKTGSRQFIVSEGKLITTDKIKSEKDKPTDLEVLLRFNDETGEVEIGTPYLPKKAKWKEPQCKRTKQAYLREPTP